MYVAYFDESGNDHRSPFFTVAGVLVRSGEHLNLEIHSAVVQDQLYRTIGEDSPPASFEWKGSELFNRRGKFDPFTPEACIGAYRQFIELPGQSVAAAFVTSFEKQRLLESSCQSANMFSVGLTLCLPGVQRWMHENDPDNACVVVFDSCSDKKDREALQESFQRVRGRVRPPEWQLPWANIHDEMYFGDSAHSVGLQTADMFAYVLHRHDSGQNDPHAAELFAQVQPRIFYRGQLEINPLPRC